MLLEYPIICLHVYGYSNKSLTQGDTLSSARDNSHKHKRYYMQCVQLDEHFSSTFEGVCGALSQEKPWWGMMFVCIPNTLPPIY